MSLKNFLYTFQARSTYLKRSPEPGLSNARWIECLRCVKHKLTLTKAQRMSNFVLSSHIWLLMARSVLEVFNMIHYQNFWGSLVWSNQSGRIVIAVWRRSVSKMSKGSTYCTWLGGVSETRWDGKSFTTSYANFLMEWYDLSIQKFCSKIFRLYTPDRKFNHSECFVKILL